MKEITSLITILFISLLSSPSWSEIVFIEDLVQRNGLHFKKFSNTPFSGEVSGRENGEFKNGLRHGLWEDYYESGQLYSVGVYEENKRNGHWNFYKDGWLWNKAFYNNGKRHGDWEYYHDDGKIAEKISYQNGEIHGTRVIYFINGQTESIMHFNKNAITGISLHYSENGHLRTKRVFKDRNDFLIEEYHENGVLSIRGNMTLRGRAGLWKYFSIDGKPLKTEFYQYGKLLK